MSIFCPFCLTEHDGNVCKKDDDTTERRIPQAYINDVSKGTPVYPIVTIGYTGCGKTTYLSSLIYSLYHRLPKKWISIRPLNQETIDKIESNYIPALQLGEFPPPTDKFFEEPLILRLTIYGKRSFAPFRAKKDIILVIYDTKGGTYQTVDIIKDNFPLIKQIPNLILLIDLYGIEKRTIDGPKISADMKLHSIVNKLTLALDELHAPTKKKNLIVCFTKTDEFWDSKDAEEDFGSIAKRPRELKCDMTIHCKKDLIKSSEDVLGVIKERYNNFFEIIDDHFGGYCFVTSSNIGCKPTVKLIDGKEVKTFAGMRYNPMGVVDPILWLLSA